ncbi:MAG: tRNA (adenosine(37)-N6)-threonylcarbamoyltransferase complex transferase subunit TsaD [Bacteroidota bacterium]
MPHSPPPIPSTPTILGIETSCDDTAAAVLRGGRLASSVIASQRVHAGFGGVVPELASRAHQRLIVPTVEAALEEAGVTRDDLDAVAVTYGPGLAGSLLVGLSFGKALAFGLDVPLVGVNHLDGHIYSVFVTEEDATQDGSAARVPPFPYLCLTVSGGHTQLVRVDEGFQHTVLGTTRDDAAGEAFDKVAKMLGLGYPGGPVVDKLAREGDPAAHTWPDPRLDRRKYPDEPYGFSFSGLKTAVLYHLRGLADAERDAAMQGQPLADLCASFQQTVVDALVGAIRDAVAATGIRAVAIVGGVSANSRLRADAQTAADADGFDLFVPRITYSIDNAAMIAVTGHFQLAAGHTSPLDLTAVPNLKV